jgi:alcohol-forming fatty acyl-CoA reductase
MIHVQKKIAIGMDVLKFFTMNDWNFKSGNFQSLVKTQSKDEHDMFFIDSEEISDINGYLRNSLIGGRQYCAKDPLSTIPRAKIIVKV